MLSTIFSDEDTPEPRTVRVTVLSFASALNSCARPPSLLPSRPASRPASLPAWSGCPASHSWRQDSTAGHKSDETRVGLAHHDEVPRPRSAASPAAAKCCNGRTTPPVSRAGPPPCGSVASGGSSVPAAHAVRTALAISFRSPCPIIFAPNEAAPWWSATVETHQPAGICLQAHTRGQEQHAVNTLRFRGCPRAVPTHRQAPAGNGSARMSGGCPRCELQHPAHGRRRMVNGSGRQKRPATGGVACAMLRSLYAQ
mmetsp:Transcript_16675/g.42847  ORF Transcript_16675/g.42847 Transcript_16675/m.42847 type:complete len:255 (-) Transcript_16675:830-1594(-)